MASMQIDAIFRLKPEISIELTAVTQGYRYRQNDVQCRTEFAGKPNACTPHIARFTHGVRKRDRRA